MSDDGSIYYVEKILNKKIKNDKLYYLVKWMDWPTSESTWEPIENLENVLYMIKEFDDNINKTKKELMKKNKPHFINRTNAEKKELVLKSGEACSSSKKCNSNVNYMMFDLQNNKKINNNISEAGKKINVDFNAFDNEIEAALDKDIPDKVIGNKLEQDEFYLLISWKERPDGTTPKPEYVSNLYLKKHHPTTLIDFYVSKIKFLGK